MTDGSVGEAEHRDRPHCGAALVGVGTFWTRPTHGHMAEERDSSHLHIFLSYGHDASAPLVERLRADLAARPDRTTWVEWR
ncbi:MAG: hypothetical protein NTX16_12510 [Actinobacteria bacterium]|nr:hypothetical protein [Actinomycetota bacterium]